ncbi:CGNR zinc finger domain-containing protein [Hypericibacter sp.]|uniref:CGNR zinc finger domain-containing protein n=1 Tax=Hypericibacter sp. TaxID=2705401 RepID=UPI003D6D36A3
MQRNPIPLLESAEEPPSRAGGLALIGGIACLNFANTSSGRGTPRHQEHLRSYDLLLVWAEHAGLLAPAQRQSLSELAALQGAAAARVLRRALDLREAIYATAEALGHRTTPPADALLILNQELSRAMSQATIRPEASGFAWDWSEAEPALDRPLWPIARSAAELLTGPAHEQVKQCPGAHCGWVFLDLTKNHRRRWCEMEVCGSRAKVRRYRERRRQADAA